jgi:predicted RNA polymerase sigma factor
MTLARLDDVENAASAYDKAIEMESVLIVTITHLL